jgi:hypothetical protein
MPGRLMTFLTGREEVMRFHRIQQYELIYTGGRWYRPRAFGDRQPDGTWHGWLTFFPIDGSSAIAPPGPETTQSTWAVLVGWAADLTLAYLEGALARALRLAQQPLLIDQLTHAEYEALEDAERLERSAEVERTAADLDEAAASGARADAERIRRQRLDTERALAATEEAAAKREANVLAQAAREARAVAADAVRRRRSAHAKATPRTHTKRRGDKKYLSR